LHLFEQEEIALEDLKSLSLEDIKGMGVPLGPSKRMYQSFQTVGTGGVGGGGGPGGGGGGGGGPGGGAAAFGGPSPGAGFGGPAAGGPSTATTVPTGGGGGAGDTSQAEAAVVQFRELACAITALDGCEDANGKKVKLKPSEKRQIKDVDKGVSLLEQRLGAGAISGSVSVQLGEMGTACEERNWTTAHQVGGYWM
jgi:hypothetical protein